jgi:hypothetical protein
VRCQKRGAVAWTQDPAPRAASASPVKRCQKTGASCSEAPLLCSYPKRCPSSRCFDPEGESRLVPTPGTRDTVGWVMGSVITALVLSAAEVTSQRLKACRTRAVSEPSTTARGTAPGVGARWTCAGRGQRCALTVDVGRPRKQEQFLADNPTLKPPVRGRCPCRPVSERPACALISRAGNRRLLAGHTPGVKTTSFSRRLPTSRVILKEAECRLETQILIARLQDNPVA